MKIFLVILLVLLLLLCPLLFIIQFSGPPRDVRIVKISNGIRKSIYGSSIGDLYYLEFKVLWWRRVTYDYEITGYMNKGNTYIVTYPFTTLEEAERYKKRVLDFCNQTFKSPKEEII